MPKSENFLHFYNQALNALQTMSPANAAKFLKNLAKELPADARTAISTAQTTFRGSQFNSAYEKALNALQTMPKEKAGKVLLALGRTNIPGLTGSQLHNAIDRAREQFKLSQKPPKPSTNPGYSTKGGSIPKGSRSTGAQLGQTTRTTSHNYELTLAPPAVGVGTNLNSLPSATSIIGLLDVAKGAIQYGKDAVCKSVVVEKKLIHWSDVISWDNFQKLNGSWGAFGDGSTALTLYDRLQKIKYLSRGTTGGLAAFSKNTFQDLMKSNTALGVITVVMAGLDTDLGRFVIEGAPEGIANIQKIVGSTSEDWNELMGMLMTTLDRLINDPNIKDKLWDELINEEGYKEILQPFELIINSVFQGIWNMVPH